jgi:SAM-dependent methyltransferase
MTDQDPTRRFSQRAENYARYRPGYPSAVLDCLREEGGLTPMDIVADIGSGTGILTEMFLGNGNTVYAVEPNGAMRREAERLLGHQARFISVNGRAEATTLPDQSIDLVVAGQAFHWFDAAASSVEFGRILRPGGFVALIWNARDHRDDPLMTDYERVLGEFGLGYNTLTHRAHAGDLDTLFQNGRGLRTFTHTRPLDFETLWGGFLSASYAPLPDDPRYAPMYDALRAVFDAHQHDGRVMFLYETYLYFGRL